MQLVLEAFSVALLLRTLFDPFRQISAGQSGSSFDAQVRALGDRAFSRLFGAVVRSIFILIGLLGTGLAGVFGVVELLAWPFMPVLPLAGVVLAVMGVKL